MNYTKNYRLPQWVKEDRIMMDDFNAMNSSIEAGLTATAGAAAEAKATANQTASTAYSTNNKPYKVGSYTGTGENVTITLGFRPSFLIVSGTPAVTYPSGTEGLGNFNVFSAGNAASDAFTITDTGFIAKQRDYNQYPKLSHAGLVYDYIAFQ